jgi:hypothetical protein
MRPEEGLVMALTVKKVTLWRAEVTHQAGKLADILEPLAQAGANLRLVMGYAFPSTPGGAAIEVSPISGKKVTAAAKAAGLSASPIACLLVEGDDRAGLGAAMARAVGKAGINISFLMAATIGRKFSALFGFESDADATAASKVIKAAAKPAAKARKR